MSDYSEWQWIIQVWGEDLRASLTSSYPWLPSVVVTGFSLINSIRIFAYLPQILKAAQDQHGASAISSVTWGLFFLSHVATVAYALVNLADVVMALIFLGNALACLSILIIATVKRKRHSHPKHSK